MNGTNDEYKIDSQLENNDLNTLKICNLNAQQIHRKAIKIFMPITQGLHVNFYGIFTFYLFLTEM